MPDTRPRQDDLWRLRETVAVHSKVSWHLARTRRPDIPNSDEVDHAERARSLTIGYRAMLATPWPADFPTPQLAMPDSSAFHPDYFSRGIWHFASARLRDALAQPDSVIQFVPVELVAGSAKAHAQDYCFMRVLACQPAMDMQRSDYAWEDGTDHRTGQPRRSVTYLRRFIFAPDFRPHTEVCRVEEIFGMVLVTDAVALRALRAGCTGVEFRDPTIRSFAETSRIRTITGVAEVAR
jgi:hypothetical protein